MGKYEPLGSYLREQRTDAVAMSFEEIERITGKLPEKSQRYRAWWSNNPSNNVMTKVWVDAGFRTEQVDMEARRLVFRRVGSRKQDETAPPLSDRRGETRPSPTTPPHPLYGALKGLLRIMPGTNLTKPADPAWGKE